MLLANLILSFPVCLPLLAKPLSLFGEQQLLERKRNSI